MISRTVAATSWALHARGLSPSAWKILMILAHRVHPTRGDYDVWPHQQRLADDCDMPLSTLKRNLNELEDKQFILRSKRYRKSGGVAGCTYTLNVKASFALPNQPVESYDFEAEDEDDTLAQNELARSPKNGLAIEYSNSEDISPSANAEGPLTTDDLFGNSAAEATAQQSSTTLSQKVEAEWKLLKAEFPGIAAVRKIDDGLAHMIETRAKQHRIGSEPLDAVWAEAFAAIRRSEFLQGRAPPGKDRTSAFKLSLAWLAIAKNFREVIGGKYDSSRDPALYDPDTGRRFGPAEQAFRGAVASIFASPQRPSGRRDQAGTDPVGLLASR